MVKTIEWVNNIVKLIDQTKLPHTVEFIETKEYTRIIESIKKLEIRGAPAIGVATAMGMALSIVYNKFNKTDDLINELINVGEQFKQARPTAVNLFWAVERMLNLARNNQSLSSEELTQLLIKESILIGEEDEEMCRKIGDYGANLVPDNANILTHCNAGALATAGYGTALGVIRSAHNMGKKIHVYVDETRPLLQGSRLTAWELTQEGIPMTLITDNMAGFLMSQGKVDLVITGADRIAANGDTANKIGTYSIAVLANVNNIPFYIAAPFSTIDINTLNGKSIKIEERNGDEVRKIYDKFITLSDVKVVNPAFDITPNNYIKAIITEKGILTPPFEEKLKKYSV